MTRLITLMAVSLLCMPPQAKAGTPGVVAIVYLALKTHTAVPSTVLDPPPFDGGRQGVRLGVADNVTTGRFTGQDFRLLEVVTDNVDALSAAFSKALANGERLFVADLPASALQKLAALPEAQSSLILDAATADDALRGEACSARVLHMLPSRAMLADALMQYLVSKNWRQIMLLTGRDQADRLYAAAMRHAAEKFQVSVTADRNWDFNASAQQADTGHYQVNDEVAKATQGAEYDVLVVADEAGHFGLDLAYRTQAARPVAGTQGLVPAAWARAMDEYASTQLQGRFFKAAGRWMTVPDYGGWLAAHAIGEAATRAASTDPAKIIAFLRSADFSMSGYKGAKMSFRGWDGQLRQPVLLADAQSLVSVAPLPGFLHEIDDLDSLGVDRPETTCRLK